MNGEFTHLRAIVTGVIPDLIMQTWQEVASDHVATGFYRSWLAFSWLYPYQGGDLLSTAVANTAPYARVLEDGHPGFHMPEKVDWAAAEARGTAHRTKDGRRFIIVPFRHFTPGSPAGGVSSRHARAAMTPQAYALAKTLGDGREARRKAREAFAARGRNAVPGNRWMSKAYSLPSVPTALRDRAVAQEGHPGYTWRAGQYEGMTRRTQTSPNGTTSSTYQTFRVMMEDSVGWYMPPMPGYGLARQTKELVEAELSNGSMRAVVAEAARADVVELVEARLG